jgi:hypothetical protein
VHDIVDLETRGIPSMFIASSEFRQAAIAQSVADYADQAFEEILGMITAVDTTH